MEGFENLFAHFLMLQDIYRTVISPAEDIQKNITKANQVKGVWALGKVEVVVKINPTVVPFISVDENMVSSDIPMLETVPMEQDDRLH